MCRDTERLSEGRTRFGLLMFERPFLEDEEKKKKRGFSLVY